MTLLPDRPAPVGRLTALSEPVDAVHPRWVLRVTLAGLGLWAGFFGPVQVLLAQQAEVVSPGHKEFVFGLVTGVGSAVSQTLGIVGGVGVATATGGVAAGYVATAAAVVVLALPYVLKSGDVRLDPAEQVPFGWPEFLAGFWLSPRRHPDFAWAWLTRFLVNLGNSLGTLLLYFYLQDAVRYPDPETGVFALTVVYALFIVLSTVVFGIWSDRLQRRKPFVIVSGVVTGLAALTLALVQTWEGALVGAVVLGVGYGVYLSVDFALCTEVLPTAATRARDLGIINVAVALPQVFAPFVGSLLIAFGGGYVTLYVVAAVVCLLGSVPVRNIRSVR
jgi:hypothetical protein